jgi:DNA repair protein RecO (recombination protein O)
VIQTEAIVLHGFDYRETSRIVRLATRDAGVVSVIARGAKRPKSRFGHGLDLFTSGVAHLLVHPARDLHTLAGFDASRARPELAASLQRFGAASALVELCLRFASEDAQGSLHDALVEGLDDLGAAAEEAVAPRALAAAWGLVGELGFAPSLDACALCHRPVPATEAARFGHRAGGTLCRTCAPQVPGARTLPAEARAVLSLWASGGGSGALDAPSVRAHQRLLREFLEEHAGDGRPLRAWLAWEALGRA